MTTYFVSTSGSDNFDGSSSQPFRTIQQALDSGLRPGDEIVVRDGTYNEAININTGGSLAENITLRAENPGSVKLAPPSGSWNAISINANHVTVQGFEIANAKGDGIEANNVHHIEVLDNTIYGSGESGIQFNGSEFILVEGNTTYDNAQDGWFSGISIYQNRNVSGDTTTEGFRTVVRNNVSYDNVTDTGLHTDGNGIIIDDFQSTQTDGYPNYTYPTLVENNLVYQNGGKGIQVTWSDYVTVRGNTAYHNNQDHANTGTWRGEISNSQSSNNTFINNIAVADPSINDNNTALDNTSYGGYKNANTIWQNNLTYAGEGQGASVRTDGGNEMPKASDGNLLGVNPEFIDAPNDFRLSDRSPAIDAGSADYGLAADDLSGADRVEGTVDMGAYEKDGGLVTEGGSETTVDPEPVPEPETETETETDTGGETGTGPDTEIETANPDEGDAAETEIAPEPTPENTAPDAARDTGLKAESGVTLSLSQDVVLANDTDADGDNLTVVKVDRAINGSVSLNDDGSISFTPDSGFVGKASFRYQVSDGNGGTDYARAVFKVSEPAVVTPEVDGDTSDAPFSLWDSSTAPKAGLDEDTNSVELGLKFTADVPAELDGLRIFVGSDQTDIRSISLWTESGERIAKAGVDDLSGAGWQEVHFDAPVAVEAGETYIASYFTTNGNYVATEGYFDSSFDAGPVSVEANAGVYTYHDRGGFPEQSYNGSNYWVDLLLDTDDEALAAADAEAFVFARSAEPSMGEVVATDEAGVTAGHAESLEADASVDSFLWDHDHSTDTTAHDGLF